MKNALHDAVLEGNVKKVKKLLAKGGYDVNYTAEGRSETLLWIAASEGEGEGQVKVVQALIGAGADVNMAKDDGYTPLHMVAFGRSR